MLKTLASGQWLTTQRIRFASLAMIACTLGLIGFLFITAKGTLDAFGRPLGTDFSNVWTAGWMANHGDAAGAWDWPSHYRVQQWLHDKADVDFFGWHYPPPFLLVAALLAHLPYVPALILWQLITLLPALWLCQRLAPGRATVLAALGAPVTLICLGHGQNGFLTATLLGGGFLWLERRPWLAGILLGCLCYKPQFALLIVPLLLVMRNWRAFLAAGLTVCALSGLTLALWGLPVWQAFLESLPLTKHIVIEQGDTGWYKLASTFAAIRMWGAPVALAYGIQALTSIAAIGGALLVAWRSPTHLRGAAALGATLLSTPYVLDYDLVVLGMAAAFLVADIRARGALKWELSAVAFAWAAPLAGRAIMETLLIPVDLLALMLLFGLTLRRALALDLRAASRALAAIA